ncbi:immunoglobulin domain protein [Opisthorchis viverrini]|uniref:Immunoglobulin domain protein n=1 Tax=Opisthorchis viverrini TaxID=6198 RepID=A0A1S8XAG1_OPIVI|nr:immunoglobulin domain protein [Opisthorchis viverrini]
MKAETVGACENGNDGVGWHDLIFIAPPTLVSHPSHELESFLIQLLLSFVETASFQQNSTSLDPVSAEKSTYVEALWDVVGKSHAQAAIQAGESITFLCRIWQARESGTAVSNDLTENRQSVFLYCPLSVAYCAQDCLLVEHSWPIRCTRQFRSYESYQIPSSTIRLPRSHGWELQEVIYKINIAVVGSSGLWTCSYGGINSNAVKLRVRDRPVLLSFTSNPPSPIIAGTAVNLTCEAAPSPNAPWYNFVWRRIGSRIPPVHSTVRLSDTVSVLTLTAARSTDDGTYSCRVTRDLDSSGSIWWNDEKWKDLAIEGRQNQNKDTATSFLDNRTLTPDQLILKLDVYHPPANLTFSTDPIGPHRVGSTVTLTCLIHGGKPEPVINFYRITATDDDSVSASHNLQYFNRSGSQNEKIRIRHGLATLSWIAHREDNGIKFGCSAASVVITGRLLSSPVRLSVIFPPGPPILTAFPQSAVSENRTRIFKCRSSSGSNPPALVKWKLYTSVDYITSSGTGSPKQPTISRALDRLLSGTKEAHVFDASEIDDFQADGRQVTSAYQGTHHRDPNNQGFIAYGEARLVSRPWYNGARVSCHLDWPVKNVLSNTTSNANHSEEDLEYLKPAYLTTEKITTSNAKPSNSSNRPSALFTVAPSIVTLSVDPRNGIQEFSGQQVIECATTSSIPQAQITWLRRRPKQVAAQENSTQPEKQAESSCCGTLEDPLETFKDDEIVEDGVNIDMLPGLYGGKRVVSRLTLTNVSRDEDGTIFVCKVTHVEWLKSIGRLYQLVVLYPPTMTINLEAPSQIESQIPSHISLTCVATGGCPAFPNVYGITNRSLLATHNFVDHSVAWKFSWTFHATFPHPSDAQGNEVSRSLLENHIHPVLAIRHPKITHFGEYTCHLEGPGGSTHVTKMVQFAFPPEIVPHGATVFTAAVGSPVVMELYVWTFPYPTSGIAKYERYFTPNKLPFCRQPAGLLSIANKVREQSTNHSFVWFKVPKSEGVTNSFVTSRQILSVISRGPVTNAQKYDDRLWSDVILVNFASNYLGRATSLQQNQSLKKIPTLVYRLFLTSVATTDYGDYMLEIEHPSGRKTFLARLQPPGESFECTQTTVIICPVRQIRAAMRPNTPIKTVIRTLVTASSEYNTYKIEFRRTGATVQLRFDPKFMRAQMYMPHAGENRVIQNQLQPANKRETPSIGSDKDSISRILLRVCTLPAPKSMDSSSNGNCDDQVSVYAQTNEPLLESSSSGEPVDPPVCVDRLLEQPEKGLATVHLLSTETYHPSPAGSPWYFQQPLGPGQDERIRSGSGDPVRRSLLVVSRGRDHTLSEYPDRPKSYEIDWAQVARLTYQFRFYNAYGGLLRSTEWFYEDSASPMKSQSMENATSNKPSLGLLLWLLLVAMLLIAACSISLLLIIHRKRRRKRARRNGKMYSMFLYQPHRQIVLSQLK